MGHASSSLQASFQWNHSLAFWPFWPLLAGPLEITAGIYLFQGHWAQGLLVHGIAAAITTFATSGLLSKRSAHFRARASAVAATLALGLPLLGICGVWLVVLPAMIRRQTEDGSEFRVLPMPSFDGSTSPLEPAHNVSEALLRGSPSDRIAALKALRRMAARQALPPLRHALNDPDEDVRLLAFAIVEQRERGLRAELETLEQKLAQQSSMGATQPGLHLRIAELHYELVHAGFASGDGARAVLEKVCEQAEQACQGPHRGAATTLLGRALLALQRWDDAEHALINAGRAGVSGAIWRPLLAEALFARRQVPQLKMALANLPKLSGQRPLLASLVRHWATQ